LLDYARFDIAFRVSGLFARARRRCKAATMAVLDICVADVPGRRDGGCIVNRRRRLPHRRYLPARDIPMQPAKSSEPKKHLESTT